MLLNTNKDETMFETPSGIFVDNKYTRWYFQLIEKRIKSPLNGCGERHHYIPTSIVKNSNVVYLSYREHYIAHLLLTKATVLKYKRKMMYALTMMKGSVLKKCVYNSRLFDILKTKANSFRSELFTGRKLSSETKQKLSLKNRGRKMSTAFRARCSFNTSGENNPMFDRKHSDESKQKMRDHTNVKGENNPMFGIHRVGENAPNFNRIWVNNGIKRKMIKRDEQLDPRMDGGLQNHSVV